MCEGWCELKRRRTDDVLSIARWKSVAKKGVVGVEGVELGVR